MEKEGEGGDGEERDLASNSTCSTTYDVIKVK